MQTCPTCSHQYLSQHCPYCPPAANRPVPWDQRLVAVIMIAFLLSAAGAAWVFL